MDKIKYYLKQTGILSFKILIETIITSTMYYFHIINDFINNVLILLLPIISVFITTFKMGKNAKNKGYLEGIKMSVIIILLLILLNVILFRQFDLKTIIFYTSILLSSLLGSMLGINKSKD